MLAQNVYPYKNENEISQNVDKKYVLKKTKKKNVIPLITDPTLTII